MITWFSDLDNTLIYSHRKCKVLDRVLVEILNGKEQSYVTRATYDFLCQENRCELIPVTTRNIEQFKRIRLFEQIEHKYALVDNGAVLLINGEIDKKWYEESKLIAQEEFKELNFLKKKLVEFDIKEADGMYFYFKAEDSGLVANELINICNTEKVYIGFDARKVYCIPKSLSKGNAVERFCKRFYRKDTISSGDSEFDISMFNKASVAIYPACLAKNVVLQKNHIVLENTEIFSDDLCSKVKKVIEEYKDNELR